jgi:hypothetical protein
LQPRDVAIVTLGSVALTRKVAVADLSRFTRAVAAPESQAVVDHRLVRSWALAGARITGEGPLARESRPEVGGNADD